jgi:hypothetical protein
MQIINEYQDEFMYWGVAFDDYKPATAQKAVANISWLSLFFLNYSDPVTPFTRILRKHGENLLLFSVIQAAETVSYASAVDIQAIVSPVRVEEIVPEAGYIVTDYLALHVFAPVRYHDKIRRKGVDYEVKEIQEFDFQGDTVFRRLICRRLLGA